ncbi:MAG: HAD family hydrolase [Candidatus Woesearchaeota archaeon]
MIKGVAFDAGGVILLTKNTRLKTKELLREFFPNLSYKKYKKNFEYFKDLAQTIKSYSYESAVKDCLVFSGVEDKKRIKFFLKKLSKIKPELIKNCEELFCWLKKKRIKIIILSDTHYNSSRAKNFFKSKNKKISKMIDFIITSKDVGCKKPNKKIFSYTCKVTGLNKNEIIFVSDDIQEIRGAKNFGFKTLYFSNENKKNRDALILKSKIQKLL